MTCVDCTFARQVGDKSRQDLVGCSQLLFGGMDMTEVTCTALYEGWVYSQRHVGDLVRKPDEDISGSHLSRGYIIPVESSCKRYEQKQIQVVRVD